MGPKCTSKHTSHPQVARLDCLHSQFLLHVAQLRLGGRLGRLSLYVCAAITPVRANTLSNVFGSAPGSLQGRDVGSVINEGTGASENTTRNKFV